MSEHINDINALDFAPPEVWLSVAQRLWKENIQLKHELAEARQTIEDVATGAGITCPTCGHDTRWCKCNE